MTNCMGRLVGTNVSYYDVVYGNNKKPPDAKKVIENIKNKFSSGEEEAGE